MTEELGKIGKPAAEDFKTRRKLYFIPLVLSPGGSQTDFQEKVNRYWEQVKTHVANLEVKLGEAAKVYHELITTSGEEGIKAIEELKCGSYQLTKTRVAKGAQLQLIEDNSLLTEFMDWSRCLAIGLLSEKVLTKVYESYTEAHKRRNEHLAKQIDETLKNGEAAVLLMREGHQVQFPPDIEVF